MEASEDNRRLYFLKMGVNMLQKTMPAGAGMEEHEITKERTAKQK